VVELFPLKPADIIAHLKLRRPIYKSSTNYGHFGREHPDLNWERNDKVADLKSFFRI
jgi:S-adenosylmethionine synthetase